MRALNCYSNWPSAMVCDPSKPADQSAISDIAKTAAKRV